jgi:DNA-binding winged helix-turn-helix (wHTH) protein
MFAEYTPSDWRLPGCDQRCELRTVIAPGMLRRAYDPVHDPEAHEEYGARRAMGPGWNVVRTGPLVVDLTARTAALVGRELTLTQREWTLLEVIVRARGGHCTHQDIGDAFWPGVDVRNDACARHSTRVWINRLRGKLGTAGALVQTVVGRGYRLLMAPPSHTLPPPRKRWALAYDACVRCHTKERAHVGRGYCSPCREVMRHVRRRVLALAAPRTSTGKFLSATQRDAKETS